MKRQITIIFLVITALSISLSLQARDVYRINRNWKFFRQNETGVDRAVTVALPHTWNTDALCPDRNYYRGEGNYSKNIDIPAAWNGKRVFVRFHGANSMLTLAVNGRLAGQHRGGYTACTFEITDLVKFGTRNTLLATVNNSPQPDILPTAGDANCYGGLFRDVELIVTGPVCIAPTDYSSSGIYISSHRNSQNAFAVETLVRVSASHERNVLVEASLIDAAGEQVATGSDRIRVTPKALVPVALAFTVENPHLWDGVRDPYLYDVCVKVWNEGQLCDSVVVRTGLRDYGFDRQRGFFLNGNPYRLRGVTMTQDRALEGNAVMPYQVAEDVELIREMGANIIYLVGGPHCEEFYTLCDQAGIMVWSELPFTGEAYFTDRAYFNTDAFRKNGRQQLIEMIRQQFNHPSVVMWGLFNCLSLRGDDPVPYIKELAALAKKEDPGRYTACVSNRNGEVNFITDLVMWRQRFGWNEGSPADMNFWLSYLHRSWPNLSSAVSYGAGASIRDQSDSLRRPDPAGAWHPERWQAYVHEETFKCVKDDSALWAIFVDNLFDCGATGRENGNGLGINDMGLVTFDRKYKKDAFYFYKANWNTAEPFVYLAERRWDNRRSPVHTLKTYSNCPEVEVVVNGVSLGMCRCINGVAVWRNVTLKKGYNTIEARAGQLYDKVRIHVEPEYAKPQFD